MVYVIILNWNGGVDTCECLWSLLNDNVNEFKIVICDNNSKDDSIKMITSFLNGKHESDFNHQKVKQKHQVKPISYKVYNENDIRDKNEFGDLEKVVIIENEDNYGFSGGNNIGIEYSIKNSDCDYIWLLNNDTVIDEMTLVGLIEYMRKNPECGICGSVLLEYDPPFKISSYGGTISKTWGRGENITVKDDLSKLDYVIGASYFISEKCIKHTGFMPEEYFLYYEDVDYCYNARSKGFEIGIAENSYVYHKEGQSTGVSQNYNDRSELSDLLFIRNRLIFCKKYFNTLYTVYLGLVIVILNRFKRMQFIRALKVIGILLGLYDLKLNLYKK